MQRFVFQPVQALKPFIKSIEIVESTHFQSEGVSNQYLPDGYFELGINLSKGKLEFRNVFNPPMALVNPVSYFAGQGTSGVYILPQGHFLLLMVKIYPWAGQCLTAFPLGELTNTICEGRLIFERGLDELEEKLLAATNHTQRVIFVQHFLVRQLRRCNQKIHPVLRTTTLKLFQTEGQVNLGTLCKTSDASQRTIQRLFRKAYGIRPKQLSQQLRLRHFARLRAVTPEASLTELALRCGYFDQAHFNHDFRVVAGTTPREFFSGTPMMADFIKKKEMPRSITFV